MFSSLLPTSPILLLPSAFSLEGGGKQLIFWLDLSEMQQISFGEYLLAFSLTKAILKQSNLANEMNM